MERKKLLFLAILVVLFLTRFIKVNGGVILGEPDEFNLTKVGQNFKQSIWPTYEGKGWYYELPLFPLLGLVASKVVSGFFTPLRVVSVLASFATSLGLFYFLKKHLGFNLAVFGSLLFALIPFGVFYSRVGVLEVTWVTFAFLSLILLDLAPSKKKVQYFIFSGFFLGLSLATKYSAISFAFFFGVNFLIAFVRRIKEVRYKDLHLVLIYGLNLLIPFIIIFPLMLLLYLHDPFYFKDHFRRSLGLIGGKQWSFDDLVRNTLVLFRNFSWWFSLPVGFLTIVGLFNKKLKSVKWLFLLVIFLILTKIPLYPRYFYVLVPFLAIFAASGLSLIVSGLGKRVGLILAFLTIIFCLVYYPQSINSSYHHLVEETSEYIARESEARRPAVLSNYWPAYFCQNQEFNYCTWFTSEPIDFSAFYPNDRGLTVKDVLRSEEEIWYIGEELYSRRYITPSNGRKKAYKKYLGEANLVKTVLDPSPNFPFSKEFNTIKLYRW